MKTVCTAYHRQFFSLLGFYSSLDPMSNKIHTMIIIWVFHSLKDIGVYTEKKHILPVASLL